MKIEIWDDSGGEWCKMFVDGELFRQGHSERAEWWSDLITSYNNRNEKLSDIQIESIEYHSVYAYKNEHGNYDVKIESGYGDSEFIGCIDSISDIKLKYDANGLPVKEDIYIDVIGVNE